MTLLAGVTELAEGTWLGCGCGLLGAVVEVAFGVVCLLVAEYQTVG